MSLFSRDKTEFDPERELSPEQKQWKPEWLRSDRERHEADVSKETDKKERARELKQAAKKRGEALEKKREEEKAQGHVEQASEPEIAPKGEKLRKKWRHAILEKSHKLLDFFRRSEPEVIDGVQLAEIMVAERIVALNEHLGETEPKTDERRATKTELDFMGLLSEKLSTPDVEVPREIADVHAQIVQASAEIIESGIELDGGDLPQVDGGEPDEITEQKLSVEGDESTEEGNQETDQHDAFVRHGVAVLAALKKVLRTPSDSAAVTTGGGSGGATVGHTATDSSRSVRVVAPVSVSRSVTAQAVTSPANHSPLWAAATIATTAAVVGEMRSETRATESFVAPSPSRVTSPSIGGAPTRIERVLPTREQAIATSSYSQESRSITPEHIVHTETTMQRSSPEHPATLGRAGVRFEQMETRELLEMAKDISIGHGQYLKRAYETGQIDRDGLIQVLKAKKRGQDYSLRYRLASRAHHERVVASRTPERLAEPSSDPHDTSTAHQVNTSDEQPLPRHEQSSVPEAAPQTAAQSAEKTTAEIIDEMRAQAANEHPVPIGAILVGVGLVIATGTIYFMFFR